MPQFPRSLDEILAMLGGGPIDPPPLPPSPLQGVPLNTPRPWLTDPQGQAGRQGPPADDPMLALRGASSIGPVERPPGYEVADWMTQGMAGGEPGPADLLLAAAPFVGKPLRAFHGSPHNFDRFDLSKIGTGEGAQVRGYGHYFAEEPEVAARYREALTRQVRHAIEEYQKGRPITPVPPGRTYEVNLNLRPDQIIDQDLTLDKQPHVIDKLKGGYFMDKEGRLPLPASDSPDYPKTGAYEEVLTPEETTGRDLTQQMYDLIGLSRQSPGVQTQAQGGPQAIELARYLRQRDLHGSQFLDQGSRRQGEGTHNYVVWNDAIIDIIKKYGLLPPATIAAIEAERQTQTPTSDR